MRAVVVIVAAAALLLTGCSTPQSSGTEGIEHTTEEDMAKLAQCLRDRGWDAQLEFGAIGVEVPKEQAPQYEADNLECLREIGIDPDASLGEEDYEAIYAWHVEIAECLAGAGMPTPEVPSYEVFRSTYDSDPWIPWSLIEGADYAHAADVCPVLDVQP